MSSLFVIFFQCILKFSQLFYPQLDLDNNYNHLFIYKSCQHFITKSLNREMSKITPFLEEVVYLVADLLASLEHTKEAEKLKK